MGSKRRILTVFLGMFFAWPCRADWSSIGSGEFEMADPPEIGSAESDKDFAELHRLQERRDRNDCRIAAGQLRPDFASLFGGDAGVLTAEEIERAEPLLDRVFRFTLRVAGHFKSHYRRPRPYDVDETIRPCVRKPGGAKAYPSSHAATASAGACVLARLFPAKAKRIAEYGDYVGRLRVIVGVHHPSDVKAGQTLGKNICDRLLSEDDFRAELP